MLQWNERAALELQLVGGCTAEMESITIEGKPALRICKTSAVGFLRVLFAQEIGKSDADCCEITADIFVEKKSTDTKAYLFAQTPFLPPDWGIEHTVIKGEENFFPEGYVRAEHRILPAYGDEPTHQSLRLIPDKRMQLGLCVEGGKSTLIISGFQVNDHPVPMGWPAAPDRSRPTAEPYTRDALYALLAQREDVIAQVEQKEGVSSIAFADGRRTGIIHNNWGGKCCYGGFAEAGYHIHRLVCRVPFPFETWNPDVMEGIERAVYDMLQQDPSGVAMFAVSCNSSHDWNLAHPDDIWTAEDGDKWCYVADAPHPHAKRPFGVPGARYTASYGSPTYLHMVEKSAKELAQQLSASPVSRVIGGFAISGGSDGQFYCNSANWGAHMDWQFDHSRGNRQGFENWLREKYGTEQALRAAWKQPNVTFSSAEMASEALRVTDKPFLCEGCDNQQLIDSWDYRCYAPLNLQNVIAVTLRKNFRKPVFFNTWVPDVANGHPSNKYMLREMLDTLDGFDANAEVQAYRFWREVGGCGYSIGTWGSYNIRKKLLIAECDYRTYRSNTQSDALIGFSDQWLGVRPEPETFCAQLLRDAAAAATHGMGMWMYDMKGGWYDAPELWASVKDAGRMVEYAHRSPRRDVDAAIFLDEKAGRRVGYDHWHLIETPSKSRYALGYSGINADNYLLSDLEHPDLPDYRFYIFPSLHTLTRAQAMRIRGLLERPDTVVLIQGAMALGSADFDPCSALEYLTGWKANVREAGQDGVCTPVCEELLGLHEEEAFIPYGKLRFPAYEVPDDCAAVIGRFADGRASHVIGMVNKGYVCVAPHGYFIDGMLPQLLHKLGRLAGVSAYGSVGNVTLVGNGVAAVHKTSPEEACIWFKKPVDILDPLSMQTLAQGVTEWRFDMGYNTTDYVFYR